MYSSGQSEGLLLIYRFLLAVKTGRSWCLRVINKKPLGKEEVSLSATKQGNSDAQFGANELPRLITEKEAAALTGLSVAWFQRKRWEGGGPPYIKLAHAVRYRVNDLSDWIDKHAGRNSTSENATTAHR